MVAEPLVSVVVLTFNHEAFIAQCIDSILQQKTAFSYEIIASDDASTDETPEILQKLTDKNPKIKLNLRNKNGGPAINFEDALQKCSGKYIAYCEGDDFWTNTDKLQIHLNALEQTPQLSIVFSNYGKVDSAGKILSEKVLEESEVNDFSMGDFIDGHGPVLHASLLRKSIFPTPLPSAFFTVYNPDVFILGWALCEGRVKYINETMSMYRTHNEGIYSSLSKDEKRILRYATRLKFFESMGSAHQAEHELTLKSLTQTLTKIREKGKRELYRKYRKSLPLRMRISLSLKRFYSRIRS